MTPFREVDGLMIRGVHRAVFRWPYLLASSAG